MITTKADPILPILTMLQHKDRFVRAAMLEQVIADGMALTTDERRAIFERPDWHAAYPDLDVALAAFYTPDPVADLPYATNSAWSLPPVPLPPPEPRIWHVCADPNVFCQQPHRSRREVVCLIAASACITAAGLLLGILPHVVTWQ